jgi:NitT/TauT family transport system substrate-binding protein
LKINSMNRARLKIPGPAVFAVAAIAAFFSPTACRQQDKTPEQSTLRVGVYLAQDYLPFFVVQEQELDRTQGIKLALEKKTYSGGAAVINAIAAGAVDLGSAGSVPLISAAALGVVPDKVLAVAANSFADPDHPASAVLADSYVTDWKDLEGKLIAVNAVTSIQGVAIKARLKIENVKNYKLVEVSFANMGLAVSGGNVAAAALYEPFLSQSLLRGDGKLLGWIIGGPPFVRIQSTLIVFNADLYRNKPETVKAFLRAYLQAVEWINKNPERARSVLARWMELDGEIGRKIQLLRWPENGLSDAASLEQIQSIMMDVGMLKEKIAVDRIYDETLLKEVLAEKAG